MSSTMELFIGGTVLLFFFGILNWIWENEGNRSGCAGGLIKLWVIGWIVYAVYHFVSKYW